MASNLSLSLAPQAVGIPFPAQLCGRMGIRVIRPPTPWGWSVGENNAPWTSQNDFEVVQGFLKGLPGARDALGDRLACVHAYIEARNSRLGRPLESAVLEDLRQDCQMTILQSAETYSGASPLSAWAQGFVRFAFLRHFRRQRSERAALTNLQQEYAQPEVYDADPKEASAVTQALSGLTEIERQTLSMRIFEDLPFSEIALQLGEPLTTTKSRFARLIVRLGPQLQTLWKRDYNEGNE